MFKNIKHAISAQFTSKHESLLFGILMVIIILGPIMFVPSLGFSIVVSKGFFILAMGLIGLLVYSISVLKRGEVSLPRGVIWVVLAGVVGIGLIGSIFSPAFGMSFFGYGFETTTWIFMAITGLLIFLAYRAINSHERLAMLYGGLMIPFIVLVIIQIIRYIAGPLTANIGVLWNNTATLIGSWSDLGIFLGLMVLLSVITLELAGLKRSIKIVMGIVGVIAVVFLAFMNIRIIWIVLGFISLVSTFYLFSFAYWDKSTALYRKEKRIPVYMLGLFIVTIVCIFFGGFFNNLASKHQNIAFNDARLAIPVTVRIAEKSVVRNFATGFGPNMFNSAWSAGKPPAVAGSIIAGRDFDFGFGYIPTHIATGGILGAITWISFFALLIFLVIKTLTKGFDNALDRYFTILLGVSLFYLITMVWVYIPGTMILVLFAILTGAFLGIAHGVTTKSEITFSFIKDPRASFFGILGVTALIVVTIIGGYVGIRKFVSFIHYTNGQNLLNQGKLDEAEAVFAQSTGFSSHDIYHIPLVNLSLQKVNSIVANPGQNKDALSAQVNQILGTALGHAQAAIAINPSSYKNWILLGDVYRFMVSFGVTDAFDRATEAYNEATWRNPNDAGMKLYFAQLAIANQDITSAQIFIKDSIDQYPTADAYVLRSQIEINQDRTTDGLLSLKQAVILKPYDASLVYNFGVLLFNTKNYNDSILAFQRAVALNNNFGEAYIYLGVAYEKVGDSANAKKVFTFVRSQLKNADDLINRVRGGSVEAPTPQTVDQAPNPVPASDNTLPDPIPKPAVAPNP